MVRGDLEQERWNHARARDALQCLANALVDADRVPEGEPMPASGIADAAVDAIEECTRLRGLLAEVLREPHPETGELQLSMPLRHRIRLALGEVS